MSKQTRTFTPDFRIRADRQAVGIDRQFFDEVKNLEQRLHSGNYPRHQAESEISGLIVRLDATRRRAAMELREELQARIGQFETKTNQQRGAEVALRRLELRFKAMDRAQAETLAERFTSGATDLPADEALALAGKLRETGSDLYAGFDTIARQRGSYDGWRADQDLSALDEEAARLENIPAGHIEIEPGLTVDALDLVDFDDELNAIVS